MKRLAAIAMAALAVGGCGRSGATPAAESSKPTSASTAETDRTPSSTSLPSVFGAEKPPPELIDLVADEEREREIQERGCTDPPHPRPVPDHWVAAEHSKEGASRIRLWLPSDWTSQERVWVDSTTDPRVLIAAEWTESEEGRSMAGLHDLFFSLVIAQFDSVSIAERLDDRSCLVVAVREGEPYYLAMSVSDWGKASYVAATVTPEATAADHEIALTALSSLEVIPLD